MEAFTNALYAAPPSWINSTPESQQNTAPDASQPAAATGQSTSIGNAVTDEWNKQHPSIDLHDQTFGIADIQAAASSNSSAMVPLQHYLSHAFAQPIPPASGTVPYYAGYNVMGYGQTQWPQQAVPLSTYSTLNGATSGLGQSHSNSQQRPQTPQQSQQQPQHQGQASPPHATIDPTLTVNGTSSRSPQIYSPPQPANQQPAQGSPTASYMNQFHSSLSHPSHQAPTLSLNPMLFATPNMSQQRTLSPQQLQAMSMIFYQHPQQIHQQAAQSQSPPLPHTQAPPIQTNLTASSSNSTSSTSTLVPDSQGPSQEELKQALQDKLKTLISPSSLGNASTVRAIVRAVDDRGAPEVEPPIRVEIMSKIRDNAGNQFFRAWSESVDAMDILREWLKAGAMAKDDGQLEETIMPLLHVIDRLPLTIEQLKQVKIGKIIVKLTKDPPNAAIKDMASNIERKWRQMMTADSKKSEVVIEDKTKKRKLADGAAASSKSAPPAKKVAVASTIAKAGVKKEGKVVVSAKTDSSFFSAPKSKPKLPSFKKAATPSATPSAPAADATETSVTAAPAVPVANGPQDPFKEALLAMGKRTASPAVSTPEPMAVEAVKKRKTVTWAADGQLEKIRLIEKAVYDDDPADGVHHVHSVRELERGEGAALHAQNLFEELVDWYEPILLEIPEDILQNLRPGADSEEKARQAEREKGALASLYTSGVPIPDSPAEPDSQIQEDQVDVNCKIMLAGGDIQPFFQQAMSVSDLVGQLRAPEPASSVMSYGQGDVAMSNPTANGFVNTAEPLNVGLRNLGIDASALTELAQQLGQFGPAAAAVTNAFAGYGAGEADYAAQAQPQQNWGGYSTNEGYGDYDERDRSRDRDGPRGRGWRGRGRGGFRGGRGGGGDRDFKNRRQLPCTFYAQGRCKFGDLCDYSHEQPPPPQY